MSVLEWLLVAACVLLLLLLALVLMVVRNYAKIQRDTREALHELCNVLVLFQGYVNLSKMSEELTAKTAVRIDQTAKQIAADVSKAG